MALFKAPAPASSSAPAAPAAPASPVPPAPPTPVAAVKKKATKKKAASAEATTVTTAAKPVKTKKAPKTHPALTGKTVAFFGRFLVWPNYHHALPETLAKRFGAHVVLELDDSVDLVVFGEGPGAKADAQRKAEKLKPQGKLQVMNEAEFRELVRIDLTGKTFAFAGGFDISPGEETDGLLKKMIENVGGIVVADVTDELDYFAVGARKGDKKIARVNLAKKLVAAGEGPVILDERSLLQLVRKDTPAAAGAGDFSTFIGQLYTTVDEGKLGRALKMLKGESFKLFTKLDDTKLVGVVKSQTGSGDVYAPWITSDGKFGCCNQHLDECMGLGGVCKHLLVVMVGLVRTDNMKGDQALSWLKATRSKGSKMDKDGCAATFVQYKGAEAGTIDWRPTETLPEDFMAL